MKKYKVKLYYSSFCSYEVEANSEEEAIVKARGLDIKENEIIINLESWEDADIAEVINHEEQQ